ncbi:Importin subunit alpha-4 [Trichoplax sp. H2]|nr:Importin subunit alpha-4 [Trichoplax sp. H2]|eukprot:RDD38234.1 Importin subunit alpha-4 [Trichoplax sp. H2]
MEDEEEKISTLGVTADPAAVYDVVQHARQLLTARSNPPVEAAIRVGLVDKTIECLRESDSSKTQHEAAWILSIIASSDSRGPKVIVNADGIPVLVNNLSTEYPNVCEKVALALAFIAGDCIDYRNKIIDCGVMTKFDAAADVNKPAYQLESVAKLINKVLSYPSSQLPLEIAKKLTVYIVELLDKEILTVQSSLAGAAYYLTRNDNPSYLQVAVTLGLLEKVVKLLSRNDLNVQKAAIRVCQNVSSSDYSRFTQALIDCNAQDHFELLLKTKDVYIILDTIKVISNIATGSINIKQVLLDVKILPTVFEQIRNPDMHIVKEICWVIDNFITGAAEDQLQQLCEIGIVDLLYSSLLIKNHMIIRHSLAALLNLIEGTLDDDMKLSICTDFDDIGGLIRLEIFLRSESDEIRIMATTILHVIQDIYGQNQQ